MPPKKRNTPVVSKGDLQKIETYKAEVRSLYRTLKENVDNIRQLDPQLENVKGLGLKKKQVTDIEKRLKEVKKLFDNVDYVDSMLGIPRTWSENEIQFLSKTQKQITEEDIESTNKILDQLAVNMSSPSSSIVNRPSILDSPRSKGPNSTQSTYSEPSSQNTPPLSGYDSDAETAPFENVMEPLPPAPSMSQLSQSSNVPRPDLFNYPDDASTVVLPDEEEKKDNTDSQETRRIELEDDDKTVVLDTFPDTSGDRAYAEQVSREINGDRFSTPVKDTDVSMSTPKRKLGFESMTPSSLFNIGTSIGGIIKSKLKQATVFNTPKKQNTRLEPTNTVMEGDESETDSVNPYEAMIKNSTEENMRLRKENESLRNQCISTELKVTSLQTQLSQQATQIQDLESKMEDSQSLNGLPINSATEEQLREARRQIDQLEASVHRLTKTLEEERENITKLTTENVNYNTQLYRSQNEYNNTQQLYQNATKEIQFIKTQLNDERAKNVNLTNQIQKMVGNSGNEAQIIQQKFDEFKARAMEKLESLNKQNDDLQSSYKERDMMVQQHMAVVITLRNENQGLTDEMTKLENEKNQAVEFIQKMKQEMIKDKQRLQEVTLQIQLLKNKEEELSSANVQLIKTLEEARNTTKTNGGPSVDVESTQLKLDKIQLENQIKELREEVKKSRSKAEALKLQLQMTKNVNLDLQTVLKEIRKKEDLLSEEIKKLKQELAQQTEIINELNSNNTFTPNDQVKYFQEVITNLNIQIDEMKKTYESNLNERESAHIEQLESLKAELSFQTLPNSVSNPNLNFLVLLLSSS